MRPLSLADIVPPDKSGDGSTLAILDDWPAWGVFLLFLALGCGVGALLRTFRTPEKDLPSPTPGEGSPGESAG
jgi:hypothetical protein